MYYQQCRHLVEGLEHAELAVSQLQSSPSGLIKVTAPAAYGERYLAPLLNQFIEAHPQLNLELTLTNQKLDLLESGIDIAIRLGRLEDSTLIAKRLASRQLHVCASPDYLAKYGEPHTLSELQNHVCLVGTMDQWRFNNGKQEKAIRVNGRIKCNNGYALYDAAKRGLGLVQLPDYYVQSAINSGELMEVLKQYRTEKEGIWALYPHNRNLSPKIRLLIEFLTNKLASV